MAESVLTSSPRSPLSPSAPRGPGSPCYKKKKNYTYTQVTFVTLQWCSSLFSYLPVIPEVHSFQVFLGRHFFLDLPDMKIYIKKMACDKSPEGWTIPLSNATLLESYFASFLSIWTRISLWSRLSLQTLETYHQETASEVSDQNQLKPRTAASGAACTCRISIYGDVCLQHGYRTSFKQSDSKECKPAGG